MSRERTVCRETYRKGALKLNAESLPDLHHRGTKGQRFRVVECEVLAIGIVEREGKEIEYQDLRVYTEILPS